MSLKTNHRSQGHLAPSTRRARGYKGDTTGSVSTPLKFGACSVARRGSSFYKLRDGDIPIAMEGHARGSPAGLACVADIRAPL
jgi:hypothetical protein